jgi:hypothetical protein
MNTALRPERPLIITIICILGFIGSAAGFLVGIIALIGGSLILGGFGMILGILILAIMLLNFWPLIGLWNMQKWGVIWYTVLTVISLVFSLINGTFSWWTLLINIAVIAICFSYYKQMQ